MKIEINLSEQYAEMLSEIVRSVDKEQREYDNDTWTHAEYAEHLLLDAIRRDYNKRFEE